MRGSRGRTRIRGGLWWAKPNTKDGRFAARPARATTGNERPTKGGSTYARAVVDFEHEWVALSAEADRDTRTAPQKCSSGAAEARVRLDGHQGIVRRRAKRQNEQACAFVRRGGGNELL
ncbi:hypothetical protein ERJ75_000499500 [Trypanosoma vivax]|nr:hypothetical protein ERJ75_000499500 [Trypanosoma vivax]